MKARKILIFKLGLLGDVLMTTPFVRALRHSFPDAEIQYWVGKSYRVALEGNPHLSQLVKFDDQMFYRRDWVKVFKLWRELRREHFDLGFFLGKHWIFNVLAASLGIPCRIAAPNLASSGASANASSRCHAGADREAPLR